MTTKAFTLLASIVAATSMMGAESSLAATATTTFQVLFKVNKACTVAATNLNLGEVETSGTVITVAGNGSVTVTCSKKTPYTIGLVPANASTVGAGVMAAQNAIVYSPVNADSVTYQLYRDAAKTLAWGNTAGTNTVAGTGTGVAQAAVVVYGSVTQTPLTSITPDNYADTVTVNVVY